jgi:hypothetical protein
MSVAAALVLALGLGTTMVLVVMTWALIRHLKVVLGSLKQYSEEVQPMLEEIQRASLDARERAETVPSRIPQRMAGARLRKSN